MRLESLIGVWGLQPKIFTGECLGTHLPWCIFLRREGTFTSLGFVLLCKTFEIRKTISHAAQAFLSFPFTSLGKG